MLHYFNPGHESAIVNGSPYYHAPANVLQMQRDLAFLPAWYAETDDFVLTEEYLPGDFQQFWLPLESFRVKEIPLRVKDSACGELLTGMSVWLWGVSPQSIHHLQSFSDAHALDLNLPEWDTLLAEYSHRRKSADVLRKLSELSFVSDQLMPHFFTSLSDIEAALTAEKEISFLAKAPYSSSGRGLLWLPKGNLTRTEKQILHGYLKKQQSVSLEYVLQRETDFAMEFYCDGIGGCRFMGYSLFETSDKGTYTGNVILPQPKIASILFEKIPADFLEQVKEKLTKIFSSGIAFSYCGYLGVDMMIYSESGVFQLHPCVEINLRSNMGILCIKLQEKHVHREASGHFFIEYFRSSLDLLAKHQVLKGSCEAIFQEGKMSKGYFPLCPVTENCHYLSYVVLD